MKTEILHPRLELEGGEPAMITKQCIPSMESGQGQSPPEKSTKSRRP